MPSSYKYQPLSSPATQIRLLELLPGRGTLQCRLKVVELEEVEGTYEPISYCWKTSTRTHWWGVDYKEKIKQKEFRMSVDGADLYITESLRAVLQRLRLKAGSRMLWADAVCINQEDDKEKGTQVVTMGKIYQSGKQTIAWLGNADRLTGRVFRYLKETPHVGPEASGATEVSGEPREPRSNSTTGPAATIHETLHGWYNSLLSHSGISLLRRPYFNRAWIVQEVVLSKNAVFMCGKYEITWDELYNAIRVHDVALPSVATLLDHSIMDLRDNIGGYCLETILSKVSHTKTSEPRDKLYSALGLHQNCPNSVSSIRVDYSQDVDEVFLEATRLLLSQSPFLNLLSMSHCTNPSKGKHIPSWVWNPECGSTEYHLSWAAAERAKPFNASRRWTPRPEFQAQMIGLLGFVFDKVSVVGKCMPVHSGVESCTALFEALQCYFSWVDVSRMHEQDITDAEAKRRMCAFRCTITPLYETYDAPDKWYSNWNSENQASRFSLFHTEIMKRFSRFFSPKAPEAGSREALSLWADFGLLYLRSMVQPSHYPWSEFLKPADIRAMLDRCFVMTGKRKYALCPPDTKPNDRLVLLQGATVPIILRPSGENWTLVGECYVYGVMHGELWDPDRCEMLWIE